MEKKIWTKRASEALFNAVRENCDLEVVLHAVSRGGRPRTAISELWALVLKYDRQNLGEGLLEAGIPNDAGDVVADVGRPSTLEWARRVGLRFEYVSSKAEADVLVKAAELGLKPGKIVWDGDSQKNKAAYDPATVSESLDYEVIEAFFKAGVTEGFDPSLAIEEGRNDVLGLYERFGLPTTLLVVRDGKQYVSHKVARVPEGVVEVAADAFEGLDFRAVELPSTLRKIGDRAFARGGTLQDAKKGKPLCAVVPPSVTDLGYGAFFGFDQVTVYDTINPDASLALDPSNGETDATVGWLGIRPARHYLRCAEAPNSTSRDFEVVVKSAATEEVKYRVFMPVGSVPRDPRCIYASSWGPCAHFEFDNVDGFFDELPSKRLKLKAAVSRLAWPANLPSSVQEKLEDFVRKNSKDAVELLADADDADSLRALEYLGLVTKRNADARAAYAMAGSRAPKVAAYISSLGFSKATPSGNAKEGKAKPSSKGKKPLVWNPTRTREFLALAESGDIISLEEYMSRVGGGSLPDGEIEKWHEVSKPHARLWLTCCERLDIELMDFLASKGLKPSKADWGWSSERSSALLNALCLLRDKGAEPGQAKAFAKAAIKRGVRFKKADVSKLDVAGLFSSFEGDAEFLDCLRKAGLLFNEWHLRWIKEDRWAMAYVLNRGVRVSRPSRASDPVWSSRASDSVWERWRSNPSDLSYLIPRVPVGAIEPQEDMLELVAAAGDLEALEALREWPRVFEEDSLSRAAAAASDAGNLEIAAWLRTAKAGLSVSTDRNG